jgi:hypothetical protein
MRRTGQGHSTGLEPLYFKCLYFGGCGEKIPDNLC